MDALTLARCQFGITTIYHFFFVPLTLGLSLLVALMESIYVRTGNETFKRMAQFWGRLFLINFAMGVVTGIVQEFQFGMNWSTYSRFVGDIFGAPLALEALLAFFLESTFLGVWLFGWDKLSKGLHLTAIWLVAIGSILSAFWILIANSFMQEPVGYTIRHGRAEMTNFFALLTNSNLWYQFPHVLMAGLTTAAFFVIGISAYHVLKRSKDSELFRHSLHIGVVTAVIASFLVATVGHLQGQHLVQSQPMKMAAAEALWNSEDPASLSLFAIINEQQRKDVFSISVPDLLSIMSYNKVDAKVQGINDLQAAYQHKYGPGDYIPPVTVTFWSFRIMVGAGTLMILLSLVALFFLLRKELEQKRWLLWLFLPVIGLPYLANTAGWIMTEMGRQPWIVFGLLKTAQAVSPNVNMASVLISLISFTLIYGGLAVADVYLLVKHGKRDPITEHTDESEGTASLVEAY